MADGARVIIDGREVEVPVGTGLVEAAAQADIEIPVFCYEPRIGPAVGACRMCLVEIEGMPKLQTACSTPVRDGMVVSTANARARDAQEAVLEFLLINHPLDCPVCDKGGECPLQDHTYRWGPGASRFHELKRNADKPIPISPLIALDRERCILCYRCSRFSAEVSGDNQLVARQRGANSVIATFEGRPYEGHFSGNVIELCPVGALTSTEYRFRGRPWDTVDHPTTCNLCPVGCSTYATVREGQVVRMLARENEAVDGGWLCDRGRFAYEALNAPERIVRAQHRLHRGRPAGNRPMVEISLEGAMEWLHERVTQGGALWVLSGSETLEEAYTITRIAQATAGRVVALGGGSAAGPVAQATIDDVERARHLLVLGDADLAETAPILDLRVRKAVRAGASLTTAGIGGTRLGLIAAREQFVAPGRLDAFVASFCEELRTASGGQALTEPGVVVYRDGELSADSIRLLTETMQLDRPGCGLVAIPAAPNARGLAALDIEPVAPDVLAQHEGGIVLVNVDPARECDDEVWGPALAAAPWLAAVASFHSQVHEIVDLVVPAPFGQEKDGTIVNLEGRLQRLATAAELPGELRAPLTWLAGLARRLGVVVPGNAAGAYRVLAADLGDRLPAATMGDIPAEGALGVTGGPAPLPLAVPADSASAAGELTLFASPFLYDAADVEHVGSMDFLRAGGRRITLSREDARAADLARGDEVLVRSEGGFEATLQVAIGKRVSPGHARAFAGAGLPSWAAGYHRVTLTRVAAPAAVAAGEGGGA